MRVASAAVLSALALAACDASEPAPGSVALTGPMGAPAPTRVGGDGVTVEVPAGWHSTAAARGAIVNPEVRLVVSSGPIEPAPSECQVTSYSLAPDAVAIVLLEWGDGSGTSSTRPERFTAETLPLRRGEIECFAGRGGAAHFLDSGRQFGAYVLLGDDAPDALADEARAVLDTLVAELRLPPPVELVPLAPERVEHCRRSGLLAAACPTHVPRVRAPYLTHLFRDPSGLHVFDLERGVAGGAAPPQAAHVGVLAGRTERIASWREPWDEPAVALRDAVLREERDRPVSFGRVSFGDTRGLLFLAPPFPTGGYLGDHLVFAWRADGTTRALSLHAWEPLTEAASTLYRMAVASEVPRRPFLTARSDADGVLYLDGRGWLCPAPVLVDLPEPWAETEAPAEHEGEVHLMYAHPLVEPYAGTVVATQACGGGVELGVEAEIEVGDRRVSR